MKAQAIRVGLGWIALAALAVGASCAGGETNWGGEPDQVEPGDSNNGRGMMFGDCFTSADCKEGSCLCGVCTKTCRNSSDCPADGDAACSTGDSDSYATQCGANGDQLPGLCLLPCAVDGQCGGGKQCVGGMCAHPQDYAGPLVRAERPLPPVSGGTLALIDGARAAAASDPDHDRVHIVSLGRRTVLAVALLETGDEPGRLLQDRNGIVHVVLRGAGAVVSLDPVTGELGERRPVCQHPRGLAYDSARDLLHVACVGGELVTLAANGGPPTRVVRLDEDLRDVVVRGDRLLVSRFRSAELLVLDAEGGELARSHPPATSTTKKVSRVAWRIVPTDDGGVLMAHQLHLSPRSELVVPTAPGGYGGDALSVPTNCAPVMASAVTKFDAEGRIVWWAPNLSAALPVDVAPHPLGGATIAPAGFMPSVQSVFMNTEAVVVPRIAGDPVPGAVDESDVDGAGGDPEPCLASPVQATVKRGQLVAVAYDEAGKLVTQTRQPPALVYEGVAIALDTPNNHDTGHELFHRQMRVGLACASCHPEGNEDGHVWPFDGIGLRRTQSLAGGIASSAPFHWSGDLHSFDQLVHEVMTVRMSGFRLSAGQAEAMAEWIDTIPAWKPREPEDLGAIERGRQLFDHPQVGCSQCHLGGVSSTNETVDVGTGEPLQVPSLRGISRRPPFMHDGCAPTLFDRFGPCGGGDQHGVTSHLSSEELLDLTSYMQSL